MKKAARVPKLCLVSSSGGHWEQLQKLQPLIDKYDGFLVTEKTQFEAKAKYLMIQTDLKDKWMLPKMLINSMRAIRIWCTEKPDFVITTGTMVAYPFYLLAVLTKKKFVFIVTFGRANMPTVAGRLMEKHSICSLCSGKARRSTTRKPYMEGVCIDLCNGWFKKLSIQSAF